MTLAEFHHIIATKERKLIGAGVDPSKLSLSISTKLLEKFNYELTDNTRFKGFFGIYKIEPNDFEDLDPKFIIEDGQ